MCIRDSRYSALPGHTMELAEALNDVLSAKWGKLRGIEIVSFGVSSVKASEEDEQMLKEMQRNAAFMDPTRAAAHLVGAQASACLLYTSLVDEAEYPELATAVCLAKKDHIVDDFVYASVSPAYLSAMMDTL